MEFGTTFVMPSTCKDTKEVEFEYAGFMMEKHFCFYCSGSMLYFTKTSIDQMLNSGKIYKK